MGWEDDELAEPEPDRVPPPARPATPTIPAPVERALKTAFALEVIHQLTGWRPPRC